MAERDAALGQIIGRQYQGDFIAGQNANPFHQRSVSGVTCAFHHSSVMLSSGSPRSWGSRDVRCATTGHSIAIVRIV